ncbi:hypothetical protein C8Q76DRAFT_758665 [Earliella scabrosa]|nr:hypothetical protein C8Q76DRAFT_758665 [Earliella scabrosa]
MDVATLTSPRSSPPRRRKREIRECLRQPLSRDVKEPGSSSLTNSCLISRGITYQTTSLRMLLPRQPSPTTRTHTASSSVAVPWT